MRRLLGTIAIAVAALAPLASIAAPTVFFKPAQQTVAQGAAVSLGVWISGLNSITEIVAAFDFDIHLSNANLTGGNVNYAVSAPLGSSTQPPGFPDADFSFTGGGTQDIGVIANSFLTDAELKTLQDTLRGPTDEFLLFTLDFISGAVNGATILTFDTTNPLKLGRNVTGNRGLFLTGTNFGSACVVVGSGQCLQVSEPATYGLVALALFAAGVASRRRPVQTQVA